MPSPAPAHASSATSTLFGGSKFWVSHNVRTRSKITELIKQNGGIVLPTEQGADLKIVDPIKKNLPSGCCSYRYVELSVRRGRLEDPEKHRAGPSDHRPMGASNIPKKGTRNDFTLEEDQLLWDYLEPYEEAGAPTSGNKVFQELAQKHPIHPWQSWRSRYLKVLRGRNRPGGAKPKSDATEKMVPPPQVPSRLPLVSATEKKKPSSSTRAESSIDLKRKRESRVEIVLPPTKKRTVEPVPTWPESQQLSVATLSQHRADSTRRGSPPVSRQAEAQSNTVKIEKPSPEVTNVTDALFLVLPSQNLESESDSEGEDDDDLDGDESDDMSVGSWVDAQVETGVSDRASVIRALLHTSMDTDVALKLLKTWSAGQKIPDMPGVWTPEDDQCLETNDGHRIERVHKKHGDEACNNRWEYLSIRRRLDPPRASNAHDFLSISLGL